MLRLLVMIVAAAAVVWIASDPPAALHSLDGAERSIAEGLRGASAALERAAERVPEPAVEGPRRVAPPEPLVPEEPPARPAAPADAAADADAEPDAVPAAEPDAVAGAVPSGSTPYSVERRFADRLTPDEAAAVRSRLDQVMSRASRGGP